MATLTIRQLDDDVVARLRQQAAKAGHSMEQEVREILTHATRGVEREKVREMLRAHLARFGDRVFSDSGELIREMRDERSGLR
jgi:plasmid stability protein